jgi:hypothetical protein
MDRTAPIACPSDFALDDRELHAGGSAELDRHVAGCPRCAARLEDRAADAAAFEGVAGSLWTRIAADGRARRRRTRIAVGLTGLLAAAGIVAVVAARTGTLSAQYVAAKGGAPVEIIRRRGDAIAALAPGDEVAPGDELRFRPLPFWPAARFIQIGSVDGTGRYNPFYPARSGAVSPELPSAGQPLEGSIRLDDAPGPERLLVVLSAEPLPVDAVRRVAEPHAAAGTTVQEIDGTPVTSAWIALPKRAGSMRTP